MKTPITLLVLIATAFAGMAADLTKPIASPDLVFEEAGGLAAIEAEHFFKQTLTDKRAWYLTRSGGFPAAENSAKMSDGQGRLGSRPSEPDGDPAHFASGGAYVECLPDTRRTHDDQLIQGENFTDKAGLMTVLHYKVQINTPGRYYVWGRVFSTGPEDNGMHIGLDGQWPASGQRWQTVQKGKWAWDCKQRTPEVHTGVPMQLFVDIDKAGEHEVMISMREDGFELDKFILASSKEFKPEGQGPAPKVKSGEAPAAFPEVVGSGGIPAAVEKTGRLGSRPSVPRQPDGKGTVAISGELKQWHKVTLTLDGPFAHETDGNGGIPAAGNSEKKADGRLEARPSNPFTDLAFNVQFTHESGSPKYTVPGYFAADGAAANTSAESGVKWRAHLSPDKTGNWNYVVSFRRGANAALEGGGQPVAPFDGVKGSFTVAPTDKAGRDFRSQGRLQYVGKHYLQFAGSKEYFLKAGPDSPETLLAYSDFDNTSTKKSDQGALKTWSPHAGDWKSGDPTWKDGKGKNLIGALNYLAGKGVNAFSFLTYNAAGDGDNVWPFIERNQKLHYDCSKLDQWGIVFDHATALGLYLHFKLQENESDDERLGMNRKPGKLPEALDGGKLGIERKLYGRELIARFGHALALNWNIGEENTQSTEEVQDMVKYLHDTDPYRHHIVLHTFPPEMDKVYRPLLGDKSLLTGLSMQTGWKQSHKKTLQWRAESAATGRAWVVAHDEQNPASLGVPPDPGYKGHSGIAEDKNPKGKAGEGFVPSAGYTMHDIRKSLVWGHYLAGGAGLEYYFGYQLPENDLVCEDFRSRDKSWDYCRIALNFFRDEKIPFTEMSTANALIGNTKDDNSKFCFAKAGELYLVYLPNGGTSALDLSATKGTFAVKWFNPRVGGALVPAGIITAGAMVPLGPPPADAAEDWLAVIAKK